MTNANRFIRDKHFLIALLGHFFMFMTVSLFFLFPLFLERLGASESRIGLIMGMNSVVVIFVRPFVGRFIDIQGRKKISLLGLAILIITFPLFLLVHDAGWLPIVLRAITGLGWGIGMTAIMTMCSDLAPAGRLAHSMGIIGIAGILSQAVGPFCGEEIIRLWGFPGLFITCILLAIISFICIAFTPEAIRPDNAVGVPGLNLFTRFSKPVLIIICILPLMHGAARSSVVYFISLFIQSLHIERVGPFFVAFSIAAVLIRLGFGDISDRWGRKQVIFPAALMICLNLFLITCINGPFMVILTGFIGGFAQGLLFPALSTYIIDIAGHENKGFAISLYLTLFDLGLGLGSPLLGWISNVYRFRTMYLAAGVLLFIATLIFSLKAPGTPGRHPTSRYRR
jgi:MFS family permease